MGQLLTTKELAKYLKLTEVTVYKYVKEGKIPARRIGSRWRFDKNQIDELLRNKLEYSPLKPFVEVAAKIVGETERRLFESLKI